MCASFANTEATHLAISMFEKYSGSTPKTATKTLYLIDTFASYFDGRYGGMSGSGVLESNDIGKRHYSRAVYNMQDFEEKVVWAIGKSSEVAPNIKEPLDFVYIDGNHRYEYVKEDIELYFPKVKIGGVIGGHDFKKDEPGVIRAVFEKFGSSINNKNWDWWYVKE